MPRIVRNLPPSRSRDASLGRIRSALQSASRGALSPERENDRLAFICEQLELVAASLEQTATAWEDRGYWTKADSFRRSWSWVELSRARLLQAFRAGAAPAADPELAGLLVRLIQLGVRPQPEADPTAWQSAGSRLAGRRPD